jgi:hypothetical protein
MLSDVGLPDWLQSDPVVELTEEEKEQKWEELCKADLSGLRANFGNPGGDMYRIDGIVEKVFPVLGFGVFIELRLGAKISPEGNWFSQKEADEVAVYKPKFVLLSDYFAPDVNYRGGKVVSVIFHSGMECAILDDGAFLSFEGTMSIGFLS